VPDALIGRLAVCGPLPPTPSGIADYAAQQFAALCEWAEELVAFYPTRGPRPTPISGVRHAPVSRLEAEGPWGGVLIHLGNHAGFHDELFELALRRPSVVLLHELDLHHLVRGVTVGRGNLEAWIGILERTYGAVGASAGRRWVEQGRAAELRELPLFEPIVDASRGVIVHSEWARRRVLASRPRACVAVVPHGLPVPLQRSGGADRAEVRRRLGLDPASFVVGTFGFATPAKRLPVVLSALARVRRARPDAQLLMVGDRSPDPRVDDLLLGVPSDAVVAPGWLGEGDLEDAIRAVDVVVSLRDPPAGETSGTALRVLGAGVPLVVNPAGWFAEIPGDVVVRVAADELELAAALLALADEPETRRALGAAGRAWVHEVHDPRQSARTVASMVADLGRGAPLVAPCGVAMPRPPPPDARLMARVGAELAELGVDDADPVVESISGVLVDLGIRTR
jgi:glycosyltransferase involved in cell wall biosynthesis